eukprot:TRINITY_DN36314_c0_g1_i2.p1 TRINITY_DN36314_c0_g1~~TRINITY_DN36314_c0_g1_i2.p1  ORF type:complete len:479 (-),score=106.81 TRINITY_DN36314_c0_g1_i2:514-1950(-)
MLRSGGGESLPGLLPAARPGFQRIRHTAEGAQPSGKPSTASWAAEAFRRCCSWKCGLLVLVLYEIILALVLQHEDTTFDLIIASFDTLLSWVRPSAVDTPDKVHCGPAAEELNQLVRNASATPSKSRRIIYLKTHKTASTTIGSILFRVASRRSIKQLNAEHIIFGFGGNNRLLKTQQQAEMMYHHISDENGLPKGNETGATWTQVRENLLEIIPGGKLATSLRDPVEHALSWYTFMYEPLPDQLPLFEFIAANEDSPTPPRQMNNPLAKDFGIHTLADAEYFVRMQLPQFDLVLFPERWAESMLLLRELMGLQPIETAIWKPLLDAQGTKGTRDAHGRCVRRRITAKDLPKAALAKIREWTRLDKIIYDAAMEHFERKLVALPKDYVEKQVQEAKRQEKLVSQFCDAYSLTPVCRWYALTDLQYEDCALSRRGRPKPLGFSCTRGPPLPCWDVDVRVLRKTWLERMTTRDYWFGCGR